MQPSLQQTIWEQRKQREKAQEPTQMPDLRPAPLSLCMWLSQHALHDTGISEGLETYQEGREQTSVRKEAGEAKNKRERKQRKRAWSRG